MKKDKEKKQTTPETESVQPEVETAPESETEQEQEVQQASIDEWREALELGVKQRDEYLDSYRRAQADFQNFPPFTIFSTEFHFAPATPICPKYATNRPATCAKAGISA